MIICDGKIITAADLYHVALGVTFADQDPDTRGDLCRTVRAALLMRGESIASWARTHKVDRTMAWRAINHPHRGRVSNFVRETLRRELGL